MTLRGSINYKINEHFNTYIWAGYWPYHKSPMYTTYSKWSIDFGLSYNWGKDDKYLLALDAEDLFNTSNTRKEGYFYGNITDNKTFFNNRLLKLSFAIKFTGGEKNPR